MKDHIRCITVSDLKAYRALRLLALQESAENFGDDYESASQRPVSDWENLIENGHIQGFFVQDKLIAIAGYFKAERGKEMHKARIWGVYVHPDHRSQGIGRQVMDAVLTSIPKDTENILVHVSVDNEPAVKLYQMLGFEEFGREPKARKLGNRYVDEYSMVKFLR